MRPHRKQTKKIGETWADCSLKRPRPEFFPQAPANCGKAMCLNLSIACNATRKKKSVMTPFLHLALEMHAGSC